MESRFKNHYLFHDRDDTPDGLVDKLESIIIQTSVKFEYSPPVFKRPSLPYKSSVVGVYRWLRANLLPEIPQNSVIFGLGLGGLLAAKLQEDFPSRDISVVAFNSPLADDSLILGSSRVAKRVAIYNSGIEYLCQSIGWQEISSQAYDVDWLEHGVAVSKYAVARLILAYTRDEDLSSEIESVK